MSNILLETLKKNLETAKETNSLTVDSIRQIVKESTIKIVDTLQFNKEMSSSLLSDMLNTTISTLREIGEDKKENIKAATEIILNTVQEYFEKQYDEQNKKFEEVQKSIFDNINNLKDKGELTLDSLNISLKNIVDSAIKSTKDLLTKRD